MLPSSPVAVHVRPIVLEPGFAVARSAMRPGGMLSGSAMVMKALSRPPVRHLPVNAGLGSAAFMTNCLICRWVIAGKRPMASATVPDACGVAIDVPDRSW